MGGVLMGVGIIGLSGIWLYTTYVFFATGQTVLALISLLIPPSGVVLPFLISPTLGFIGLGLGALGLLGAAISRD
jgi:hypothetical protein